MTPNVLMFDILLFKLCLVLDGEQTTALTTYAALLDLVI